MINTQNKIGFVKYGPGPIPKERFLRGGEFDVWPHEVAVLDVLDYDKHKVRVYGPKKWSVDKPWFRAQSTRLVILSTGIQRFPFGPEPFDHPVKLLGEKVGITISSAVQYHLVENVIEAALQRRLDRDPDSLYGMEEDLIDCVHKAFAAVCEGTPLPLLQAAYASTIELAVKRQLDHDGWARRELAIEFDEIQISSISSTSWPEVSSSQAPFVTYRGPLELSMNCFPEVKQNREYQLVFEVKREQLGLLPSTDKALNPGRYALSGLPVQGRELPHELEVIVLSLSQRDLNLDVKTSHYFEFEDGTSGWRDFTVSLVLRYQISPEYFDKMDFDTVGSHLDSLGRQITTKCEGRLRNVPALAFQAKDGLSWLLEEEMLQTQPFEEKMGVHLISLHVTDIKGLPSGFRTLELIPPKDAILVAGRLEQLVDPSCTKIQVRSGTFVLYSEDKGLRLSEDKSPRQSKDTGLRLLNPGSYHIEWHLFDPNTEVTVVSQQETTYRVTHSITRTLTLGSTPAPVRIHFTVEIGYQADIKNRDLANLASLRDIWKTKDDLEKWLDGRVHSAIEQACRKEGLGTQLTAEPGTLAGAVFQLLQEDMTDSGLVLKRVDVLDIQLDEEIYQQVKRQIDRLLQAETDREVVARISPIQQLALRDEKEYAKVINNLLVDVSVAVERGESVENAMRGALLTFQDVSGATSQTPRPSESQDTDALAVSRRRTSPKRKDDVGPPDSNEAAGEEIESEVASAATLNPQLERDIETCNAIDGVKVFLDREKGEVNFVVKVPSGRIHLTLKDFRHYPDCEPMAEETCTLVQRGAEDRSIEIALRSLEDWKPGDSIEQVARELVKRASELSVQ
jgi:membrane protease subunit (stomatin/prohibitin family)